MVQKHVLNVMLLAVWLAGVSARPAYAQAGRTHEIEAQIQETQQNVAAATNDTEKSYWEQRLALLHDELKNEQSRQKLEEKEKTILAQHQRHAGLALREALNVVDVDMAGPTDQARKLDRTIRDLRAARAAAEEKLEELRKNPEENAAQIEDAELRLRNQDEEIQARRTERAAVEMRMRQAREAGRIDELVRNLPVNPEPTIKLILDKVRYLAGEAKKIKEIDGTVEVLKEQKDDVVTSRHITQERMDHIDEEASLLEKKKQVLSSRGMDRRLVYATEVEKKYLAARLDSQVQQIAALDDTLTATAQLRDLYEKEQAYLDEDMTAVWASYKARLLVPVFTIVGLIILRLLVGQLVLPLFYKHESLFIARRLANYLTTLLIILILALFFLEDLKQVATVLGIASAAIVIALQDLCSSIAGWFVIIGSRKFVMGDRVEVDGIRGDIIDIQLLRTTLTEVNNWLGVDEPTGRVVLVPNNFVFRSKVFNYTHVHPYVWNKVDITMTYETPAMEANALLRKILEEETKGEFEEAKKGATAMETRYGVSETAYQPKMYMVLADSGMLFSLVYCCHYRRNSAVRTKINKRILEEFAKDPRMQLAYPTHREIRSFEEAPKSR